MASKTLPPLTNPISANLAPSTADYLKTVTDITTYFGDNILPYRRLDYSNRQMAALNIYIIRENFITGLWWLNGEIIIEICLPPLLVREEIPQHSEYAANLISLNLSALTYIQAIEPFNPGLVEIGTLMEWSYVDSTGLYSTQNVDAYIARLTMNFKINLLEYYENINTTGDIYQLVSIAIDPC